MEFILLILFISGSLGLAVYISVDNKGKKTEINSSEKDSNVNEYLNDEESLRFHIIDMQLELRELKKIYDHKYGRTYWEEPDESMSLDEEYLHIQQDRNAGMSLGDLAKKYGCSRGKIQYALKRG